MGNSASGVGSVGTRATTEDGFIDRIRQKDIREAKQEIAENSLNINFITEENLTEIKQRLAKLDALRSRLEGYAASDDSLQALANALNKELLYLTAKIAIYEKNYKTAIMALEEIKEEEPQKLVSLLSCHITLGDFPAARETLGKTRGLIKAGKIRQTPGLTESLATAEKKIPAEIVASQPKKNSSTQPSVLTEPKPPITDVAQILPQDDGMDLRMSQLTRAISLLEAVPMAQRDEAWQTENKNALELLAETKQARAGYQKVDFYLNQGKIDETMQALNAIPARCRSEYWLAKKEMLLARIASSHGAKKAQAEAGRLENELNFSAALEELAKVPPEYSSKYTERMRARLETMQTARTLVQAGKYEEAKLLLITSIVPAYRNDAWSRVIAELEALEKSQAENLRNQDRAKEKMREAVSLWGEGDVEAALRTMSSIEENYRPAHWREIWQQIAGGVSLVAANLPDEYVDLKVKAMESRLRVDAAQRQSAEKKLDEAVQKWRSNDFSGADTILLSVPDKYRTDEWGRLKVKIDDLEDFLTAADLPDKYIPLQATTLADKNKIDEAKAALEKVKPENRDGQWRKAKEVVLEKGRQDWWEKGKESVRSSARKMAMEGREEEAKRISAELAGIITRYAASRDLSSANKELFTLINKIKETKQREGQIKEEEARANAKKLQGAKKILDSLSTSGSK